ncbi:putative bifunctional diguanylate cyclase/phosphodiesterase [Fulvimonas soli]|uniref:Diguanylate cyclase/phosphodiesterase n=1 Tax=Fulvimonas soli TaxID=155197 RepID=A0A316IJT5_9GAMM|nr:EAL domain-containing protein [Fulvimonas soli]PWK93066.1 diguanylate cyclase/phosphodiesterase [Fulvimonas soli]TNY26716.1 hypothetical protein BV497_07200 [Fulvimonas soli]
MPAIGFRLRLALFFVATLVAVQLLTALLVYGATRHTLMAEGERELTANAQAFAAQMEDLSARVAASAEALAMDYALRSAIAERDRGAALSLLRSHQRRLGASRMLLLGRAGDVEADTGAGEAPPQGFTFAELVGRSEARRAAAVATPDGKAVWVVAVPIYAPQPIGVVMVSVPLDDALLAHLQRLSSLPRDLELAVRTGSGRWTVAAGGGGRPGLVEALGVDRPLPATPTPVRVGGRDYLALAVPLDRAGSPTVAAVLGYPPDDALGIFHRMALSWAALLAAGLGLGLLGAWLTARSVSRPIESLAAAVRRIEAGDYRAPPSLARRDEIGQLASAFGTMTAAVRQREERIRYQALHDGVTDLPNRVAAEAVVNRSLEAEGVGALLLVGLARLPDIIKTMGHALFDRLMCDAAGRIRRVAAGAYVARVTDTQFVLWLAGIARAEAVAVAMRVLDTLGEPYQEPDVSIDRLPSVGIAMAPPDGNQAGVLLRHAEVAQYEASGSASALGFYEADTDPHRPERLSLMSELREALDGNGLVLHYQPKLALATRRVDGAEALVRWPHPRGGMVPPDAFIGMAEDTGNIQRLTRWALATAIAQARRWTDHGLPLQVAVNLSSRDLEDADLPGRIAALLAIHAVPAERLTVEVTERAVIGEPDAAIGVLRRLADQGVGVAIDDFGVGQSAFAYLRRLPVSELKIDRMFVKQLATDPGDQTIVRSLVELSHKLGYRVTAEGVESQGALDYLASIGCDHAQGYFIAGALETAAFEAFAVQHAAAAGG